MHDNPAIYPLLPPLAIDPADVTLLVDPSRGTPWETCWEYVISHDLSESERAAFWNGANLIFESLKGLRS